MDFLSDYTLRNVMLGTLLLGMGSGLVGVFVLLRRQSLIGDAVSHAALPGIVIAFLLTGTKDLSVLLSGAALSGLIGTLCITAIIRTTKIDTDGAQGIVLGVFLGLGFLLLTHVQKSPDAAKAGLDKFVFGQAATIMQRDVILIAAVELIISATVFLFWKELKLATFDPEIASVMGFSPKRIELIITALTVPAIVIGIQAVGVILMSALLVAPAAAARQWTDKLSLMGMTASIFGGLAGAGGSLISSQVPKLATGPVIVLLLTAAALFSIVFSPRRGILQRILKRKSFKNSVESARKTEAALG
ncbi:MAG: transition metal ABC transporter permease subunit TroC [Treponema socranskii subsp. buccale]